MAKNTIEVMTGNETIEWGMARVAVFTHANGEEVFISKSETARKIGPRTCNAAVPGIDMDIAGKWFTSYYEVDDGVIIKVFADVKKTKFGAVGNRAVMLLQMRKKAPLIKLKIPLCGHSLCLFKEAAVTGRFDILTLEQAKARGFKISDRDNPSLYGKLAREEVFKVEELAGGEEMSEATLTREVTDEEGHKRKVHVVKRMRKLEL